MDKDERVGRLMEDVEQVLRHIADGGAGGTIGPDGVHLGMPDWEERTKHLRPGERVRTHGYPIGFAKSQWMLRDRALIRFSRQIDASTQVGRDDKAAAHEAVARALDWERLLGSFNHPGEDHFPVATIDRVATNLLAWLAHQGFTVVRDDNQAVKQPLPEFESKLPNIFDSDRKLVVLIGSQEEPRMGSEDQIQAEDTDVDDDDGSNEEDEAECPICDGDGEIGSFVFEQECGGCAGRGSVSHERLRELDRRDWTPHYSSIAAAREAQDSPGGRPLNEVYIEDLTDLADEGDLSEFDLTGRNLSGFDLTGVEFGGAAITHADLSEALLDEVDLTDVDFTGVILTAASFREADLSGVDLSGSDLRRAIFTGAELSGANLAGADLRGAKLKDATLDGADLAGADLEGADVEAAASLDGTSLVEVSGLSDEQRAACAMLGARFG